MDALERRYAKWAADRGLVENAANRFEGRTWARDVAFTTGLGGSAPSPPEIVVNVELRVPAPVLLTRSDDGANGADERLALIREVLAITSAVRNVGVTSRFVRITFEPGTESDAFDAALEALEERLRMLTTGGEMPYRG